MVVPHPVSVKTMCMEAKDVPRLKGKSLMTSEASNEVLTRGFEQKNLERMGAICSLPSGRPHLYVL